MNVNVLIFGVQGSGKSTVGKYMAEKLGIQYVATGDIFRKLREENTPVGRMVKERYDQGLMVPDELTMEIVNQKLANKNVGAGFVLDGAPRNLEQVRMFKKSVDLLVLVELGKNEALRRLLSRARLDDTEKAIKKRISWYEKQTKPVVDYYKDNNVGIVKVDNTFPEDVVRENVDEQLKELKRN